MMRRPHRFLAVALAAFLPAFATRADLPAELGAVVDQTLAAHGVPGALVGVWRGNTPVAIFEKGVSDLGTNTPMSALDSLRIASVTKTFTVTRILQLQDDSLLSLNDPISKYVPGLKNGSATLRELANMTSGIFNYTEDSAFVSQFISDPTATWTDQQLVNVANAHDPYFSPGSEWHYSNTNTVLLGMVIENLTGHTAGQEITDHILTPLGLSGTIYPVQDTLPTPFSRGYAVFSQGGALNDVTLASPTSTSASGAMISHLEDLKIWGKALATGTLLSPAAQAERLQMVSTAGGVGPEYDSYGLGIGSLDGWIGHTGDFIGYQSLVMFDPANDQTVVIMENLSGTGHVPTEMFLGMAPLLSIPEPAPSLLLLVAAGIFLLALRRPAIRPSRADQSYYPPDPARGH